MEVPNFPWAVTDFILVTDKQLGLAQLVKEAPSVELSDEELDSLLLSIDDVETKRRHARSALRGWCSLRMPYETSKEIDGVTQIIDVPAALIIFIEGAHLTMRRGLATPLTHTRELISLVSVIAHECLHGVHKIIGSSDDDESSYSGNNEKETYLIGSLMELYLSAALYLLNTYNTEGE
jgi:hypothetical protein